MNTEADFLHLFLQLKPHILQLIHQNAQQGPPGPQGIQGPQGPTGVPGIGQRGFQGPKGDPAILTVQKPLPKPRKRKSDQI